MKLESHVTEAIQKIQAEAEDRMKEAVIEVRNHTIDKLSEPGKGRIYENYFFTDGSGQLRRGRKRNKPHQASAPGDAPTTDEGQLKQSIKWTLETSGREITGKVGTDKEYGAMLEFGTSKILPRPWLQKSFDESKDEVIAIFNKPMEL